MMDALTSTVQRAHREFPQCPEAVGLEALMHYQVARLMTKELPVRVPLPLIVSRFFHRLARYHALMGAEGCSSSSGRPRVMGQECMNILCHAAVPWGYAVLGGGDGMVS